MDQLALRLSSTNISPRQLVPILGIEGAKDVQEIRRIKYGFMLKQRTRALVSIGYATVPQDFSCRRGRVVGTIIHHYGIFIYTDVYKRIVQIALNDPFVLKLASPFKNKQAIEFLTHEEVLKSS